MNSELLLTWWALDHGENIWLSGSLAPAVFSCMDCLCLPELAEPCPSLFLDAGISLLSLLRLWVPMLLEFILQHTLLGVVIALIALLDFSSISLRSPSLWQMEDSLLWNVLSTGQGPTPEWCGHPVFHSTVLFGKQPLPSSCWGLWSHGSFHFYFSFLFQILCCLPWSLRLMDQALHLHICGFFSFFSGVYCSSLQFGSH